MTTTEAETPTPVEDELADDDLDRAIRDYVHTYVRWRGRRKAMERFGVSRHTLWRFLDRGHVGHALPRAVLDSVGDSIEAIDAATWAIEASERITANFSRSARNRRPAAAALRLGQEDALLQLCAAPLTTVSDLSRFNREPATTLRGRLERLAELGLADSVSHSLGALGPKPQRRYFPTTQGIHAAAALEWGTKTFLEDHPVSRQWFRILTERLDAVAVLYHVAAMIADADPEDEPVRVDHYRQGPYDLLITLSGGRSVGILRQGPTLPSPNLRYRLRTAGEPAREPTAHRNAGDHRLRPGHPPGRAHPGPHGGAPDPLRGHRGGAVGWGPPGCGLAAVRPRDGGAGEDRPPSLPGQHRRLHRLAGGQTRLRAPRQDPAGQAPARAGPGLPLPHSPGGPPCLSRRSRSKAPWPCS